MRRSGCLVAACAMLAVVGVVALVADLVARVAW